MAYTQTDFLEDAVQAARTVHAAFRRCEALRQRWFGEFSSEIGVGSGDLGNGLTGNEVVLFMSRADELYNDMTADGNAKLYTVLGLSDLHLPTEE